jgi:hypothetical protein
MTLELDLYLGKKAERLERWRLMSVVLEADCRNVVLNRDVVAGRMPCRARLANQGRDVATNGAVGPPIGDLRKYLFGRYDPPAHGATSADVRFPHRRCVRRCHDQAGRQDAQRCDYGA